MTREEAIRILDPETMRETLAEIEYYGGFRGRMKAAQALHDACILAVAALREQEERQASVTNADKIRSMTDEELAELLLDGCRGSKCDDQPQNEFGSVNCFQCRITWLQQPAQKP